MKIFHPDFIFNHKKIMHQLIRNLEAELIQFDNFLVGFNDEQERLVEKNSKFKPNTYINSYISNISTHSIPKTQKSLSITNLSLYDKNFISQLNYTQIIVMKSRHASLLKFTGVIQQDFDELFKVNLEVNRFIVKLYAETNSQGAMVRKLQIWLK